MSGRGRGRGRGRGSNSGVAPTDVGSGVVSTAHGAGQPTPVPSSSSIGRSAKRRRTDDVSNYADADADVDQQQQHNMGGVSFNPPNPNMKIGEKAESQKKSKMEALRASVMEEDIEKARPMETEEEKKAKTMNDEDLTDEEKMARLMGFSGFGTTKETKVQDNYEGAAKGTVQRKKERKYRQYMNRKGGFNRPLDQMK